MTPENKEIITRINDYANEVLGDIDPQKTQVSYQLEKLKPIMQTIADEKGISLEDMFILYMDLASELAVTTEEKFQDSMQAFQDKTGMQFHI